MFKRRHNKWWWCPSHSITMKSMFLYTIQLCNLPELVDGDGIINSRLKVIHSRCVVGSCHSCFRGVWCTLIAFSPEIAVMLGGGKINFPDAQANDPILLLSLVTMIGRYRPFMHTGDPWSTCDNKKYYNDHTYSGFLLCVLYQRMEKSKLCSIRSQVPWTCTMIKSTWSFENPIMKVTSKPMGGQRTCFIKDWSSSLSLITASILSGHPKRCSLYYSKAPHINFTCLKRPTITTRFDQMASPPTPHSSLLLYPL